MKLADNENRHDTEHRARLHSRIRMAKQILRPLPRRANLHRWPIIKWFAKAARQRPYLWRFGVREVSAAIYLGSIIAFLPIIGFQFIVGFFVALAVRANLLVIMSVQLITNLFTAAFIYAFTGWVGSALVDLWRLASIDTGFIKHAYHLTIGGVVVGLIFGLTLDLLFRLIVVPKRNRKVDVKRMLKS